jgi:hypothetical protein
VRCGKVWVQFNRALKQLSGLGGHLFRALPVALQATQEVLISVQVVCVWTLQTLMLSFCQFHLQGCHNFLCHLILHGKDVSQFSIIPLSPEMIPSGGVDQLRRNTYPVA